MQIVAQHIVNNIHSSARIQQDLELWRRFKEYDQKSAEEPFPPSCIFPLFLINFEIDGIR